MDNLTISTKQKTTPTIYAYTTPTNTAKKGWIKIGYTNRNADVRIKEQTHTVGIEAKKLWSYEARFSGGGYFDDHAFHSFLAKHGIKRQVNTEWFFFNNHPEEAKNLFKEFIFKDYSSAQKGLKIPYKLRKEQEEAVEQTFQYAQNNPNGEFLWNAKPRFGKTLSTYDLLRKMDAVNVLIVTNRPAIANSWFDDFEKFIAWQTDFKFVSESDSLKDREPLTRNQFVDYVQSAPGDVRQLAFLSLQDLKGSMYFRGDGGGFDKLKWVADTNWDVLIIDEAHEGIDTFKTDVAFDQLKRNFTLHLSGTPFKALAKGEFSQEQIYNWSYEDEQFAKENYQGEENNPYENLPRLNMFTYQMSKMITEQVNQGKKLNDETNVDFAFDLNEFFATKENGKFEHEADVRKWLDTLTRNEKYPFSTPELRIELKHTFWLLNRVASAKALESLLKEHEIFKDYHIILAAGDGKSDEDAQVNEKALKRVRDSIKENEKTITLSVGQLTTGVTIPEWSAVMMLSNLKSPSLYMQAAFRAQNPYAWTDTDEFGEEVRYQKKNAYVFDFAPERTLIIFDEFANNLSLQTASGGGTSQNREENIKRLLNFFPVIGEDEQGRMVELDASQVLTIPKTIKATEVVKRGFMSNLLFANISGIFQAPQIALDILDKLKKESQGKIVTPPKNVDLQDIQVDEEDNAIVDPQIVVNETQAIFGEKRYEVSKKVEEILDTHSTPTSLPTIEIAKQIAKTVVKEYAPALNEVKETYQIPTKSAQRNEKKVEEEVRQQVERIASTFTIEKNHLEKEAKEQIKKVTSVVEKEKVEKELKSSIDNLLTSFNEQVKTQTAQTFEKVEKEIVYEQKQKAKNKEKTQVQEDVRSRLRGFARTIPSFIMAYGNSSLTLKNFENYTPNHVFEEVTGITIDQFLFLRDGGDFEENGEQHHFEGQLFDEVVFNESVQEFLRKKEELADYFDESIEEDIFDYIPPQKTNQIFTPKHVVKQMVDSLEQENPDIFNDSSKTFVDFYMKSGLYPAEIVKRLFNSERIKKEFPDEKERIRHILENQVYGFAPSEIIYNIALSFIFGTLDDSISRKNFVYADVVPYTKEGKLDELVKKHFG